jgi:putative transposase
MRRSRYSDNQILAILKQNEQGVSVNDLCREHGMSSRSSTSGVPRMAAWMPR